MTTGTEKPKEVNLVVRFEDDQEQSDEVTIRLTKTKPSDVAAMRACGCGCNGMDGMGMGSAA